MLSPFALLTSSLGILMMSLLAMLFTQAPWATAWFVADVLLLGARIALAWRYQIRGGAIPDANARRAICLPSLLFVLFGAACSANFVPAIPPLNMVAAASLLGMHAGLDQART